MRVRDNMLLSQLIGIKSLKKHDFGPKSGNSMKVVKNPAQKHCKKWDRAKEKQYGNKF
jgi:hypothetical protein